MKHSSSYKEIEEICDEYGIKNWSIGKDGLVDIDGDVNLSLKELEKLPLNFGKISGGFSCSASNLTNLEGAPKEVDGKFLCSHNKLTSLEGVPKEVGGDFYCSNNKLTSLEGGPEKVGGDFYCHSNKLITLEGIPFHTKYLNCYGNPIDKIWKFIDEEKYLQEFVEVYDVVRPGKVVILEYLNDIRKLMGKEPVKREEIPDDWEILDI